MDLVIKKENLPEYNQLIDECGVVSAELSFSRHMLEVEEHHKVGELIVNSPLYKKYKRENGELLEKFLNRIAGNLRKNKNYVRESVKFYEEQPDLYTFLETFNPGKKVIKWADVRKVLPSPSECNHQKTETETIEITRVRCVECGRVLDEQKTKL
jgi:hypothetical protein